jgi:hypothetical protein
MSTYQSIDLPHPATGSTSFRSGASGSNPTARALAAEISTARVAVLTAFAGAVLLQAAGLALVARMVLHLDSTMLPHPAISAGALALGLVLTLAGKSVSRPRRLAA